jgi:hypothetical protein
VTDDDFLPPSGTGERATPVALSPVTGAALAALVVGCALLVGACVLMAFNVLLFRGGLRGIPLELAQFGAVLGVGCVAALGVLAIVTGFRGWSAPGFGAVALGASAAGWVAWMVAGINLLIILFSK